MDSTACSGQVANKMILKIYIIINYIYIQVNLNIYDSKKKQLYYWTPCLLYTLELCLAALHHNYVEMDRNNTRSTERKIKQRKLTSSVWSVWSVPFLDINLRRIGRVYIHGIIITFDSKTVFSCIFKQN